MSNYALIIAAGVGARTRQDIPKQFIHVHNKPIVVYTLEAFQRHPNIDEICVVILQGWEEILRAYAKQFGITKLKYIVHGGATGQESIHNGLVELKKHSDSGSIVVVHDGNRPMVSQDIITDSLVKCRQFGSAVAAIPCAEAVLYSEDGCVSDHSIPRQSLWRSQTPQTYYLDDLWEAHVKAKKIGLTSSIASCTLMESLGKRTYFSRGSEKNVKITTAEDIEIFKALLSVKNEEWLK